MASFLARNRGWVAALMVLGLPLAAEAITPPNWQDAPPMCLPSRVSKDSKIDGCTCPPKEMCPGSGFTNTVDWLSHSQMPAELTVACCTVPVCPAGTDFAGQSIPANGKCYKVCADGPHAGEAIPPEGCNTETKCKAGFRYVTNLDIPDDHGYGSKGPLKGFTGCVPICTSPAEPYNAASFGGWQSDHLATRSINAEDGFLYTELSRREGRQCDDEERHTMCYTYIDIEGIVCSVAFFHKHECVRSDSLVTLADGTTKAVTTLKMGDQIKGPDGNAQVVAINRLDAPAMFYRINDFKFSITGDHPIQTTHGWKSANDTMKYKDVVVGRLEVGDKLITKDGEVEVKSITLEKSKKGTNSVNIQTMGDKPFFVDGVAIKPFKDVSFQY